MHELRQLISSSVIHAIKQIPLTDSQPGEGLAFQRIMVIGERFAECTGIEADPGNSSWIACFTPKSEIDGVSAAKQHVRGRGRVEEHSATLPTYLGIRKDIGRLKVADDRARFPIVSTFVVKRRDIKSAGTLGEVTFAECRKVEVRPVEFNVSFSVPDSLQTVEQQLTRLVDSRSHVRSSFRFLTQHQRT